MKISKLFHWLYAILMFLPILVFIPNAFYYGFNETAIAQEKTEQIPVYYESNDINNISDFIVGRVYSWNDNITPIQQESSLWLVNAKILTGTYTGQNAYIIITTSGNLSINNGSTQQLYNSEPFDFLINSIQNGLANIPNSYLEKFSKCNHDYTTGQYQPLTTNMSITDSLSYAWDSVWQNDLFSWTNNTFLKQPFVYITDLFSIPSDNVLINALSYWLDISIIWLVFDVIMYVPLLVHRWLDKGIIE